MADSRKSITSSTYSGETTSAATATAQTITRVGSKIDTYNMLKSSEKSKKKGNKTEPTATGERQIQRNPEGKLREV